MSPTRARNASRLQRTRSSLRPLYLGLSESTLARMRSRNSKVKGPPYFRLGGSVKYKQAELDAWVERNREGADDATVGLVNGKASKSGAD